MELPGLFTLISIVFRDVMLMTKSVSLFSSGECAENKRNPDGDRNKGCFFWSVF